MQYVCRIFKFPNRQNSTLTVHNEFHLGICLKKRRIVATNRVRLEMFFEIFLSYIHKDKNNYNLTVYG